MATERRRAERGLALVSVLWGVAILSLIAAAMLTASLTGAYVGRNLWNATRGASLDEAAIDHAILSLMDGRRRPQVDGSADTFRFEGTTIRVWIQDESGKINLNFADKDLLQGLFGSAGLGRDAAETLAGRIVARRLPQDPQGAAPAVAFRSVDELLAVPGMTPELCARVGPALTVFGRNGALNRDVAPREVLLALPDMDEKSVADLLRARQVARDRNPPPATPAAAADATFTVTAEARVDGARTVRAAVVQFTGDPEKPYWFLSWK
ncbi:MAG: hypothetical protein WDN03_09645 [Rhizomicrobium sp.]